MRARDFITERQRSWGIGDINLIFDEPGPGDPPEKEYHLRDRQIERGVSDQERDAILKQLPMVRRRMMEFTRGQEFWLYDPKLNKAVGLRVMDHKDKIYKVATVFGRLPADADHVLHVPGVDPASLQEGWRDTLAGLALGAGVAMGSPAQAAGTETVVVQPGQTVYSIARAFGTTPQVIQRLNGLGPDFRVEVDQEILVPKLGRTSEPVQTKPAAKTPVANKKPAAAAPGAAAKPTKNIDVNRTLTGTRGEALVTQAAVKAGIRKRSELAALLAQTAHESNDFRVMGEDLSYSAQGLMKTFPSAFPTARIASQYANRPRDIANRAYANRNGNGDEASGDGWRYRGRGYIQLTGRENYRRAGQALGLPLEKQPDIASQPEIAAQIAVWYWKNRTKPNVRNFYDTRRVTATINPAQAGARDRQENFADFYQYLGKRDVRT
jgi:putative chitinase